MYLETRIFFILLLLRVFRQFDLLHISLSLPLSLSLPCEFHWGYCTRSRACCSSKGCRFEN
uniref:Uncharacterized protein LOC104215481 n=1 Tax=Nicotiana sylvestris TaxID=4096 RepID=A0A1U7VB49_NICSY|nr:PREDICTED: uncharacterized protein LOC104215481 [Nicotiana sylvestris]